MLRVAFDVGGVISKYPEQFRQLFRCLHSLQYMNIIEIYCISDMHPVRKIYDMLALNGMDVFFIKDRVISADYDKYGELCKSKACEENNIDILIDDFPGYLAGPYPLIKLFVWPNPTESYYHETWQTDGSEGDFGRRKNVIS